MTDGGFLQTVEFIECAVDAGVGDEVVDVVVFGGHARFVGYER